MKEFQNIINSLSSYPKYELICIRYVFVFINSGSTNKERKGRTETTPIRSNKLEKKLV